MAPLLHLWRDEGGQDLVEYSLLITFVAMACLALLGIEQPSITAIWNQSNSKLVLASSAAGGQ
jgi:Flp pilus assembly pilin Flp